MSHHTLRMKMRAMKFDGQSSSREGEVNTEQATRFSLLNRIKILI